MNRLILFFLGCAVGYVVGGYLDALTGDNDVRLPSKYR